MSLHPLSPEARAIEKTMLKYCRLLSSYSQFQIIGEVIYYGLIAIAIATALVLIRSRLLDLGYEKKRLAIFICFCAIVTFPAGYFGSRAAGMLYYPSSRWSLDFFIENIIAGHYHTYHASLILPTLMFS